MCNIQRLLKSILWRGIGASFFVDNDVLMEEGLELGSGIFTSPIRLQLLDGC
jgi:hypothetical protein